MEHLEQNHTEGDISEVWRCQTKRADIYMIRKRNIPEVWRCQTEGHTPDHPGIYKVSGDQRNSWIPEMVLA